MKVTWPAILGCLALLLAFGTATIRSSELMAEGPVVVPAPAFQAPTPKGLQTAVFAGGCFWGVQGVFAHVKGVRSVVSGYAGGDAKTAKYQMVGSGRTGHAEAVKIVYDPAEVRYGELLQILFSVVADPTTLNYQGPDRGPQYRTAIFPATLEQKVTAQRYIAQLDKAAIWRKPIVTRIESGAFYPAETYHQDFLTRNPDNAYIKAHDLPKVSALKRLFPEQYRSRPVLVRAS
ncbi:MAG: peptide-methionine (S)-S-oxide reductase MsrA [Sphingomonadaceae bacterium]